VKDDIKRLWEKCFYGDQEKNECALFNEPCSNTDENYKNLTQYSNTLNELYERNKSIFETAENWKTTWEEYIDFKKKYSDPNRFKLKDYRSLHELNKRKELITKLGSLTRSLNNKIQETDELD
jgi:succinate dehydrogenase/fumarate reductase flavoprotein subunit